MINYRLLIGASIAHLVGCSSNSDSPDFTNNAAPVISVENFDTVLREIVKIANDEALDAASDGLDPVFNSVANLIDQAIISGTSSGNGLTFLSSAAISENGGQSEYRFSCDSGGTLVAQAYKDDSVGGPFVSRMVADGACSIDDAAYGGSAYKAVRFVRGTDVSTFENFSVSHADGDSLLLHGEFSDSRPEGRGPLVETRWTDANLFVVEGGETTIIDGYFSYRRSLVRNAIPGTVFADEDPGTTAEITFIVTAPWSSGEPLDVVVDLAYVDPENSMPIEVGLYSAQWQSGILSVTATDGTRLTLSPDTGDAATFSVAIDGETGDPMILNWADGFQILCAPGFDCK